MGLMFRQGLTILERRKYREAVLQRALEAAYERAARFRLTAECQKAMILTGTSPAAARATHAMCQGEQPGGSGCLCQCHDVSENTIESGTGEPDGSAGHPGH